MLDAETGRPVPGVAVTGWQQRADGRPAVSTDARGVARFQASARTVSLRLQPPGGAPIGPEPGYRLERSMELAARGVNRWEVRVYRDPNVRKPLTLSGTVTGPGGAPLPGAAVCVLRWGETTRAVTDTAGRFAVPTVQLGVSEGLDPIVVRADRGDLSVTRLLHASDTWKPVRLQARRGQTAAVVGFAVDGAGRLAAGLPLLYWEHWPGTSGTAAPAGAGMTDASGRFRATRPSPGALYAVSVGGPPRFGHGVRGYTQVRVPPPRCASDDLLLRAGETRDVGRVTVPRERR